MLSSTPSSLSLFVSPSSSKPLPDSSNPQRSTTPSSCSSSVPPVYCPTLSVSLSSVVTATPTDLVTTITTTTMIMDIRTVMPTMPRRATPDTTALLLMKAAAPLRFYPRPLCNAQILPESPTENPTRITDTHEAATIIDPVGVDILVSLVSMT